MLWIGKAQSPSHLARRAVHFGPIEPVKRERGRSDLDRVSSEGPMGERRSSEGPMGERFSLSGSAAHSFVESRGSNEKGTLLSAGRMV